MVKHSNNFILAADLGGTSARLACFKRENGQPPQYLLGARFSSRGENFAAQIKQTLELARQQLGVEIRHACFAVAGVINQAGDYAALPNLDWDIDCKQLLVDTPLRKIVLLNDFEALGFGVNFLSQEGDLLALAHPGNYYPEGNPTGTRAVIGAGTGLGHGILVYNPERKLYFPLHSEGSHCDLAATNKLEWELVQFLRENLCQQAHPDYERVASGPGLANIYDFLCSRQDTSSSLQETINKAADKAAAITEHAGSDPICLQATQLFLCFYARAAKNLALTCMATGGVYLGGGITPKIIPLIQESAFAETFEEADRPALREALREIPLQIILNPRTALMGAAAWGG